MPVARRPKPLTLVLDLTRNLAEEFDTVPIPTVTKVVREAVAATAPAADDIPGALGHIERIVRERLTVLAAGANAVPDYAATR